MHESEPPSRPVDAFNGLVQQGELSLTLEQSAFGA
jgi:hypothetical protein